MMEGRKEENISFTVQSAAGFGCDAEGAGLETILSPGQKERNVQPAIPIRLLRYEKIGQYVVDGNEEFSDFTILRMIFVPHCSVRSFWTQLSVNMLTLRWKYLED